MLEGACSIAVSSKILVLPSLFVGLDHPGGAERPREGIIVQDKGSAGKQGHCSALHGETKTLAGPLMMMPLEDAPRGEEAHVDVDQRNFHVRGAASMLPLGRNMYHYNDTGGVRHIVLAGEWQKQWSRPDASKSKHHVPSL